LIKITPEVSKHCAAAENIIFITPRRRWEDIADIAEIITKTNIEAERVISRIDVIDGEGCNIVIISRLQKADAIDYAIDAISMRKHWRRGEISTLSIAWKHCRYAHCGVKHEYHTVTRHFSVEPTHYRHFHYYAIQQRRHWCSIIDFHCIIIAVSFFTPIIFLIIIAEPCHCDIFFETLRHFRHFDYTYETIIISTFSIDCRRWNIIWCWLRLSFRHFHDETFFSSR